MNLNVSNWRPFVPLEAFCTIGGRLYHWRPFVPLEAFCTFGGRLYLDYFPYTIRQDFFARVIANRVTEPRMCSELFKEEEKNFSKFSFSVIFSVRKNLWRFVIWEKEAAAEVSPEPWSSLVEGDEGFFGPSGKLLCLWQIKKVYVALDCTIPYMFDYWADPVVYLLLQKSSMPEPICPTTVANLIKPLWS